MINERSYLFYLLSYLLIEFHFTLCSFYSLYYICVCLFVWKSIHLNDITSCFLNRGGEKGEHEIYTEHIYTTTCTIITGQFTNNMSFHVVLLNENGLNWRTMKKNVYVKNETKREIWYFIETDCTHSKERTSFQTKNLFLFIFFACIKYLYWGILSE